MEQFTYLGQRFRLNQKHRSSGYQLLIELKRHQGKEEKSWLQVSSMVGYLKEWTIGRILDTVICVGIQNAPPSVFQEPMPTTSRINLDKEISGGMQIHSLQLIQYCKQWGDQLERWAIGH